MFAALSSAVTFVRGEEFTDVRSYNAPAVLHDIMGFGRLPEDVRASPILDRMGSGYRQSVRMCLDALGFAEAEIRRPARPRRRDRSDRCPLGTIEPGQVAAERLHWEAFGRRRRRRPGRRQLADGQENLDAGLDPGPSGQRFEVEVQGDPDAFVTIHGWHPKTLEEEVGRATPASWWPRRTACNSVPYVCAAEPGVKTYLDLPMIAAARTRTWRANPADDRGPMSLRERQRAQVLGEIQRSALSLFAERGYDAVTTEEIATAAGVSLSTYFRHVESKDELLLGPMRRAGRVIVANLQAARADDRPRPLSSRPSRRGARRSREANERRRPMARRHPRRAAAAAADHAGRRRRPGADGRARGRAHGHRQRRRPAARAARARPLRRHRVRLPALARRGHRLDQPARDPLPGPRRHHQCPLAVRAGVRVAALRGPRRRPDWSMSEPVRS